MKKLVERLPLTERTALRVPEAAELLGLPVKTVYTMIHRADFPAFRNGRTVLIHRAKLEEWSKAQAEQGMSARGRGHGPAQKETRSQF